MPASRGVAAGERAVLDNPIWHALGSDHARFAEGNRLARRYPPAVTPLAATANQSEEAYEALARLLGPGGMAGFFLDLRPEPPGDWTIVHRGSVTQMVCDGPILAQTTTGSVETLRDSALTQMIELTKLTEPGPFGPRTPELGLYLGIFRDGRLAAMAGERLRCSGFTEVSAVCTHPDYQGRGYAATLVSALIERQSGRGETPFLHVRSDNDAAIRVYERLGFKTRKVLHLAVLKAPVGLDSDRTPSSK